MPPDLLIAVVEPPDATAGVAAAAQRELGACAGLRSEEGCPPLISLEWDRGSSPPRGLPAQSSLNREDAVHVSETVD